MKKCLIAAVLMTSPMTAQEATSVWLSSDVWAYLLRVDPATGFRELHQLDDYPKVLKVTYLVVEPSGTLLLATTDATQRRGVYRYNPSTTTMTPISGGIDGFREDLLGDGPPFLSNPSAFALTADARTLLTLLPDAGLYGVTLSNGNRTILSQSMAPPIGGGVDFLEPRDMALLSQTTLLVADRFQGIVAIDLTTGDRALSVPTAQLRHSPQHLGMFPDGRYVYTAGLPGDGTVHLHDPVEGTNTLWTGNYGGNVRGTGPEIGWAGDIAVDQAGVIWVYDNQEAGVVRVDPTTGNRRIVTSWTIGGGGDLFESSDRPSIHVLEPTLRNQPVSGFVLY